MHLLLQLLLPELDYYILTVCTPRGQWPNTWCERVTKRSQGCTQGGDNFKITKSLVSSSLCRGHEVWFIYLEQYTAYTAHIFCCQRKQQVFGGSLIFRTEPYMLPNTSCCAFHLHPIASGGCWGQRKRRETRCVFVSVSWARSEGSQMFQQV